MKKKILAFVMAMTLVFSLCACGGPTPTETVDAFMTAVKAQDSESIKGIYGGEDFEFLDELDLTSSDDGSSAMDKVLNDKLLPMVFECDYTLANEQINEGKATVDITFTTYNFGTAITSFFNNYITQAFSLIFSDPSDEELDKLGATLLTAELDKLTEKNCEKTATVSLTETEEGWVIDEFESDGDFYDAITGGMISAAETIEDLYD